MSGSRLLRGLPVSSGGRLRPGGSNGGAEGGEPAGTAALRSRFVPRFCCRALCVCVFACVVAVFPAQESRRAPRRRTPCFGSAAALCRLPAYPRRFRSGLLLLCCGPVARS